MPNTDASERVDDDQQGFGLPVLMLGFNRPEHFDRVLTAVLSARPSRLYVSLDGPRRGREGDRSARQHLLTQLERAGRHADIRVRALDENQGSGGHVSGAIDWFFEHEDFGAILEDDCLPSPSFFDFVARLHRERPEGVTHLAGFTPAPRHLLPTGSMHLSRFPMTWGWATWRENWQGYRLTLGNWRERLPDSQLQRIGGDLPWFRAFWSRRFDELVDGSNSVWDYQWVHWTWVSGGRSATPNMNLVQNIGFGRASTHSFFARRSYRVLAVTPSPSVWDRGFATAPAADRADRYLHVHFYKVNEFWPVTAMARAMVRSVVNRLVR